MSSMPFYKLTPFIFCLAVLSSFLTNTVAYGQIGADAPLDPAIANRISDWENTLYEESRTAAEGVDQLIAMINEGVELKHQKLMELGAKSAKGSDLAAAVEKGNLLNKRASSLIAYLREYRLDRHDPAVPVSIGPWLDSCLVFRQFHREVVAQRGTPTRGLRNPAMPYLGSLSENIAKHTLDLHRNILILQVLQADLEGLEVMLKKAAVGGKANFVASNTALNVLYAGVENPILVGSEGVSTSSITANGMGARPGDEPGTFILKPSSPGIDSISLTAQSLAGNTVTGKLGFRVLPIPTPDLYIGASRGGVLRKQSMQEAESVVVRNSSFPLAYDFNVRSIEVVYTPEYGSTRTLKATGSRFSKDMKDVLRKQIRPNQVLLVRAIVEMPDGNVKTISSTFRIQ